MLCIGGSVSEEAALDGLSEYKGILFHGLVVSFLAAKLVKRFLVTNILLKTFLRFVSGNGRIPGEFDYVSLFKDTKIELFGNGFKVDFSPLCNSSI